MTGPGPILRGRGLGRRAAGTPDWLFRAVSLDLSPGEAVGLSGPSGAGKTLLLRALALLDPLDAGEVLWRGSAVAPAGVPAFRSRAIYVHQTPALGEGSAEAILRQPFALAVHRQRSFPRQRIVDLLASFGRDASFLAKDRGELSGGEAQIISLLRALSLEPDLLLLDEPTAALDAEATGAAEGLLRRWLEEEPGGRAYLWVSHDRGQVQRTCRRHLEMRAGRLQAVS